MAQKQSTKESPTPPKLVSRRLHKNTSFRLGRTIGARREKLETANERATARKKDKKKALARILYTIIGFALLASVLLGLILIFTSSNNTTQPVSEEEITPTPTVKVIDQDSAPGGLTSKMALFIYRAEMDFKELGYQPTQVVIPSGKMREVDFYLDGYSGYFKMNIDRSPAVSVEDADRMIRYLAGIGVRDFVYVDVRISGKAFWK